MGWVKMKLGDVIKNREGRYKPNDPTIAGLKRIDKINFSGQIFLSDKGSNTDMILIKKGDLVISGINVEKGALAVYEGEEDILATIHYSSYIFDTTKIDIDFLKVFLRSPDFIQLLKEQVPGGIKTEIKPKHILPLEVYFPETTKEQKAIALHFFEKEAKFNQLNEHISYQLTHLENLNQAILQEAVQGKLVKQDPKDEPARELLKRIKAEKAKSGKKEKLLPPIKPEEIPFEIPENWVWCRLGEIMNVKSGKRIHAADYRKEGVPFLRSGEIGTLGRGEKLKSQLYISKEKYEDIKAKFGIPKEGDILIACIGGSIGNTWVVDNRAFYYKDGNLVLIESIPEVETNFLLTYLKSPFFWKNTILNATDSSYNALTIEKLKDAEFPLPPLSEQKRIVAEIEKQLAKTKQLKEHIIANQQATEQLLKALLHQAFEVEEMETV
jgi:type I restriction enzyme S subunit